MAPGENEELALWKPVLECELLQDEGWTYFLKFVGPKEAVASPLSLSLGWKCRCKAVSPSAHQMILSYVQTDLQLQALKLGFWRKVPVER